MIKIKRIYDAPAKDDGYRILVDRLWPRGMTKEKAAIDEWYKDIAPSSALRTWFDHQPERFDAFKSQYLQELRVNPITPAFLEMLKKHQTVTFLYGARDPGINHAVVLLEFCGK